MSTKKIIITTVVTIATAVTICLGTNWYLNRQSNSTPKAPHSTGSPAEPSTPNGAQPQQLDPHSAKVIKENDERNKKMQERLMQLSETLKATEKKDKDAYKAMQEASEKCTEINAQVNKYTTDIYILGLPPKERAETKKKLAEAVKEQTKAKNEKAEAERNFAEAHKNHVEALENVLK